MKSSSKSTDRKEELKKGLEETSKYILSHHEASEHFRCYSLKLGKRTLRFCARCTGIYLGIIAALVSQRFYSAPLLLIAASGIPTLVEKYFTGVKDYRGHNFARTSAGILLGYGFFHGLTRIIETPLEVSLWALAGFYGVSAIALIYLEHQPS